MSSVFLKNENQIVVYEQTSREGEKSKESRRYTLTEGGKTLVVDQEFVEQSRRISDNASRTEEVPMNKPPRIYRRF